MEKHSKFNMLFKLHLDVRNQNIMLCTIKPSKRSAMRINYLITKKISYAESTLGKKKTGRCDEGAGTCAVGGREWSSGRVR